MIHIPFHWSHEETVVNLLKEILVNQERIEMALVTDLQASLDALTTAVSALIAKPSTGIQPAELDPIKTGLDTLTANVNAALQPAG